MGVSWLTPVAELLARDEKRVNGGKSKHASSLIFLWLAGGPSQIETFDPHPGGAIGGPTRAIDTAARGVKIAEGLPRLAEQMDAVSLVRSITTREGDHERGTYLVKTGYAPDPTVVHPAIGSIICHEMPEVLASGLKTEIPRHVSILPGQWPPRGGDLGPEFDAFKTFDPIRPVPDVTARVPKERFEQRLKDLDVVEGAIARRSRRRSATTIHASTIRRATVMMSSEQLKAFDLSHEPEAVRAAYGDTPFGRGCLAARRLIEVGVRCVEVTLRGWDTHANNFEFCKELNAELDPAFAALIHDLKQRRLLDSTVVLCGGEFGRTPRVNPADGRDHWPTGFSMALAGGGLRGGLAIGETDPAGGKKKPDEKDAQTIEDIHATVLSRLGIDYSDVYTARANRPIQFCKGKPIRALVG